MTNVIDGVAYVCEDGICRMVDAAPAAVEAVTEAAARTAHGFMDAAQFISFLQGGDAVSGAAGGLTPLTVLLFVVGGAALNLTPCVLPMVPVSLMVIGRSAKRGALYGLGAALAYGVLGLLAAVGGMAFGTIQSSPWFSAAVSLVFVAFALALLGVWNAGSRVSTPAWVKSLKGPWFAFAAGGAGAVLAGACVAPVLVSALVLTAKLYGEGNSAALFLPFALGAGMGLPWPFLGAGMNVLPKPGAWMRWVNRVFAAVLFAFAARYAFLAYEGLAGPGAGSAPEGAVVVTPSGFAEAFKAADPAKPVLVDCRASWCRSCAAMERVLEEPAVKDVLKDFSVIVIDAEDMTELLKLPGFGHVRGLPAFLVFEKGGQK